MTEMTEYSFYNEKKDEWADIEAVGFDHACNILFSDYEEDPMDWELVQVDGRF